MVVIRKGKNRFEKVKKILRDLGLGQCKNYGRNSQILVLASVNEEESDNAINVESTNPIFNNQRPIKYNFRCAKSRKQQVIKMTKKTTSLNLGFLSCAEKHRFAPNNAPTSNTSKPKAMQNVRNHMKHYAINPKSNITSTSLNLIFHTAISFDIEKTTYDIPTNSTFPEPHRGLLAMHNHAQWSKAQVESPDYGIMAGTNDIDDDEEGNEYMGESDEGNESSNDDILLDDEKDMEVVCETSEPVM